MRKIWFFLAICLFLIPKDLRRLSGLHPCRWRSISLQLGLVQLESEPETQRGEDGSYQTSVDFE